MKLRNKIIATVLCAGMTLSLLTGCGTSKPDNEAVIATVGDSQMTLGVANLMFRYTQATTGSYLKALLGMEGNLWEQDLIGNGTPYGESLKESVLSEYERMLILEQHMDEYGVEITEEEQAAMEAAADQFIADNDEKTLTQMSATKENVVRLLTLYTIEDKMEDAIKDSADVEVTDEEAAQKKVRYAYFAIPEAEETEETTEAEEATDAEEVTETVSEETAEETETETISEEETEAETEETEAISEEETEAETEETEAVSEEESEVETEETEAVSEETSEEASETESEAVSEEETETEVTYEETPERTATREEVQAIIDEVKGGKTLDDAIAEYDPDKSIIENTFGETTTTLSSAIIQAAEGLADGEICSTPAETEGGFYIVEMVSNFDEEATAEEKESLLNERKNTFLSDTIAGWEPEELTIDEKAWGKVDYLDDFYTPETEAATEEEVLEETEIVSEEVTEEASEETETEEASETESEEASETESES